MRRRWLRRACTVVVTAVSMSVFAAAAALAHPLGNVTTNAAAHLRISPTDLGVDYVLDVAEIPTVQTIGVIDDDGDGALDAGERGRWSRWRCAELAGGLDLAVDGRSRTLAVDRADLDFPPGEAGLDTLRLACDLRAAAAAGWSTTPSGGPGSSRHTLRLRDANDLGRAGWREITAAASGLDIVDSDVPATSPTGMLRSYPQDRPTAPLQVQTAAVTVTAGAGDRVAAATPFGARGAAAAADFTALVARRDLTVGFAAFAVAVALVLGAAHAVAPGHGKTVMAAFLVGTRGRARHAVVLGLTVAASHTAGACILGVMISGSQTVAPDRVYPWLAVASGVLFAVVGLGLLRRSLGGAAHEHVAEAGHDHHRHGHEHLHWRRLVAPGLAGGLVPSPSAVVVLLGGIALGRAWFGVALVAAYGLGIAVSLVGAGYLLARLGDRLRRGERRATHRVVRRVTAALPAITSALVLLGGLVIAGRGLATL